MSYYRNRYDRTGQSSQEGESAELAFKKILESKSHTFREATKAEQLRHIDFIITMPNGAEVKYDVKARKRVNRQDNNHNDDLIWLEFKNVAGKKGWLYGEADYMVFEREKDFLVVSRAKLIEFAEKKCDLTKIATKSSEALYAAYQRKDRLDCVSLVRASDIEPLASQVLLKL